MSNFHNDLGDLSDPLKYVEPINLYNLPTPSLLKFYRNIYLIRKCEETLGEMSKLGEIRTPIHLGIGQEAVAVGVAESLSKRDRVFSNHRGHSHYISMGASIQKLFAEVLGKATGASMGMDGSMHLVDRSVGFWGLFLSSVEQFHWLAPASLKRDGEGSVSVAYFGDGACKRGYYMSP